MFQLTAARRRLDERDTQGGKGRSFNSQPPEGGWSTDFLIAGATDCFNSQPPEGGWDSNGKFKVFQALEIVGIAKAHIGRCKAHCIAHLSRHLRGYQHGTAIDFITVDIALEFLCT